MRAPFAVLATILLAWPLLIGGCNQQRAPIPLIEIAVLTEPGTYLLDGERLYLTELKTGLQKLADKYRRPTTREARARVMVYHSGRIPYHRVEEVLGMCAEVGLSEVRTEVREESVPPPTR